MDLSTFLNDIGTQLNVANLRQHCDVDKLSCLSVSSEEEGEPPAIVSQPHAVTPKVKKATACKAKAATAKPAPHPKSMAAPPDDEDLYTVPSPSDMPHEPPVQHDVAKAKAQIDTDDFVRVPEALQRAQPKTQQDDGEKEKKMRTKNSVRSGAWHAAIKAGKTKEEAKKLADEAVMAAIDAKTLEPAKDKKPREVPLATKAKKPKCKPEEAVRATKAKKPKCKPDATVAPMDQAKKAKVTDEPKVKRPRSAAMIDHIDKIKAQMALLKAAGKPAGVGNAATALKAAKNAADGGV